MVGEVCVPSPGLNDPTTPTTTFSATMAPPPSDCSKTEAPGHQGDRITGGNVNNMRILYSCNTDIMLDYEDVYVVMKQYGKVEKIKLRAADKGKSYDCYVLFASNSNALLAHESLNESLLNDKKIRTKLFSTNNIKFDSTDFAPEDMDPNKSGRKQERDNPEAVWHVAEYKEGSNFMKGTEWIKWKIGNIPDKNVKRYGKAILIEADNETRASLLANFKAPVNGNIKCITPHRSFNILKGIVHSKDLYEFTEDEILERCPEVIYKVQKMKGTNNSILLFFSCKSLPEYISVCNSRIKVKKFLPNPKQCRQCLDYGHIINFCPNKQRCPICSVEFEENHNCSETKYCFHCKSDHCPVEKVCPRYKFEREIVIVAENEHISIGSAKRRVLGANRDPNSTYASIIRQQKTNSTQSRPNPNNNQPVGDFSLADNPETININNAGPSTSKADAEKDKLPQADIADELPDLMQTPESLKRKDLPKRNNTVHGSKGKHTDKPGKIDEEGFQFPNEKKRSRPVSPTSNMSDVKTNNSFSVLQEAPSKKQAVSNKGNDLPKVSLPCKPKDRTTMRDSRRSRSSDSIKSYGSSLPAMEISEIQDKASDSSSKAAKKLDIQVTQLDKQNVQKEPPQSPPLSSTKPKRLSHHPKSFKETNQAQSKSTLAGHKK